MLTSFHWGLLAGLGVIIIAVLKADYNVRMAVIIGVLVLLVLYKMNSKKR